MISMTNYLIMNGNTPEHYFFRPYEGICMRARTPAGVWQERSSVVSKGRDGFGVYADRNGAVHLICVNDENKLIYAVRKDGALKKYVLSSLSPEIYVSDMRLYNAGGRLNLLYSALYNGENLLIHCILGDHAKPSTVDTLETSHFCIDKDRVYYTDADGTLGYVLLSDEKPAGFHKLYDDAHCCTVYDMSGKNIMLFTRESKLFIDNSEILYDSRMEMPIFVNGSDRLFIMWKSGSFVRYITSFNGGVTWSEPMRFMNTGTAVSLYSVQQGEAFTYCYGYHNSKELYLLGKPAVFENPAEYRLPSIGEFENMKNMLETARREAADAKEEITRLKKALHGNGDKY